MKSSTGLGGVYRPFKIKTPRSTTLGETDGVFGTNPCAEILLTTEAEREQQYIKDWMASYMGGAPYEKVLEMVKTAYPENFI